MPKRFIKSFNYARAGARHALRTQRNLWIHFFVALVVLAFAVRLRVSLTELALLIVTSFGVIVTEMVNTALEEIVNILSPEKRPAAELAKNVSAAAVLLAALGSVCVGALIFLPKVM
ncbi:MAG: diacylglycerol kinase family protein [Candidatus Saganbacteria bacterium]|nr:diacylglycerol kinase family protein [Candidatus Saganbacteria bacterium]